jgi:hypothetical protein
VQGVCVWPGRAPRHNTHTHTHIHTHTHACMYALHTRQFRTRVALGLVVLAPQPHVEEGGNGVGNGGKHDEEDPDEARHARADPELVRAWSVCVRVCWFCFGLVGGLVCVCVGFVLVWLVGLWVGVVGVGLGVGVDVCVGGGNLVLCCVALWVLLYISIIYMSAYVYLKESCVVLCYSLPEKMAEGKISPKKSTAVTEINTCGCFVRVCVCWGGGVGACVRRCVCV